MQNQVIEIAKKIAQARKKLYQAVRQR